MRNALKANLPIKDCLDETLKKNQEYQVFRIQLFNAKSKDLITSRTFYGQDKYYYINHGDKYFFIHSGNFTNLYYYDLHSKEKKITKGIEESQENDTKFILRKKDVI